VAIDIYPIPFSTLVWRLKHEIENKDSIYGLGKRTWWTPEEGRDISFEHFGMRIGTPVGPASGPHTQLAQNLILSWLGGARFMELKTVQVLDELELPRPCINVPHIGYNVEWSQELRVPGSLWEYTKGWILMHLLASDRGPGLWSGPETIFDISVGYDLAGIKTEKVANYLRTMKDASKLIQECLDTLPDDLKEWASIDIPSEISNSVTISTFHGCPADEIEAIASHLIEEYNFHTVIKLNPTLLGFERVCDLVQNRLGYDYIKLEREPFEKDLKWPQLMDMLPRLQALAAEKGVGFGVKFSNTLVMHSDEPPFEPGEMYLSGAPLHVLALTLANEFSQATEGKIPITFSAGIDAQNFPSMVAAGIGPITTCTDLLKVRGYGRLHRYLRNLEKDMKAQGAVDLESYKQAVGGSDDTKTAAVKTLDDIAQQAPDAAAYSRAKNKKPPKKVHTALELFDCLTCDKCIPVCPNAANFAFPVPEGQHSPGLLTWKAEQSEVKEGETLIIDRKHQIGNTVEACNLCGHCDTWCPEDGGPYLVKPNLYLQESTFNEHPERDGFLVGEHFQSITWRRQGEIYHYKKLDNGQEELTLPNGGKARLEGDKPVHTEGEGEIDLTTLVSMRVILEGVTNPNADVWLPPKDLYPHTIVNRK